jgi:polyisoprenoid-binding protein YceI
MPEIPAGSHALGPSDGELRCKVYREGAAQKMGHDLILKLTDWSAKVNVDPDDLSRSSLEVTADVGSFSVVEGVGGMKPLSRSDMTDIKKNITDKILTFPTITFTSTSVAVAGGDRATVEGDLTLGGATRPAKLELTLRDGRAKGTMKIVQTEWGIKPFKAMMGALKVKDAVDVELDVAMPGG